MNKELAEVIKLYAIGSHKEMNNYLLGKSKNDMIALLTDLITMYINDKNSSTLREFITVITAGYKHSERKIGYNGYKQSSILGGKAIMCEAKPKNFDTEELEKFKKRERKTKPTKLNGQGNFTDYTFQRLERNFEENLNMLISGFVNGKLIYIIEFPFGCETFTKKLRRQLEKRFPNGDISGEFLRSSNFDHRDYVNSEKIKIIFLLSKSELEKYASCINGKFYEFLWQTAKLTEK